MKIRANIVHGFLFPIVIGVLSIAGIVLIASTVLFNAPQASPLANPTATPFKYLYLGTETHTAQPESKLAISTATIASKSSASASLTFEMTPDEVSTLAPNITPAATNTPAIDLNSVFIAGKYDDADERIIFEGDWVNELIESAFEESAFISTSIGDTASFKFMGSQFQIGYLEDPGLGTLTVSIDGAEQILDQSTGFEWTSPELSPGEHTIILTHASGELIILDYIVIIASN